ncbi:hypothetical protein [Mucilaginibacter kameinonensis]|uniref:hypothetical protein n=1 Tax=Mucilaginibacter kameinonensis TaxID=452286 RepID=UPI000EF7EBBC|nr:hypothetical protein [Mucilaginibacter kameinonensis]
MNGITYTNTKTTIPRWTNELHLNYPLGYAYETDTHFVHMFGNGNGFYPIQIGLTAIEKKQGNLNDWVLKTFGATNIQPLTIEIGRSIEGVWRPSLYFANDVHQALNNSPVEMRLAQQSLRLLIDKLDELFLYIEPDYTCLDTYSHKNRELLILACTEVENGWKSYFSKSSTAPTNGRMHTTKDYVKLSDKLHLNEFRFKLKAYENLGWFSPFINWDIAAPSTSLVWYDAYNKTKHDRTSHFSTATLRNCIDAVVANLTLHCTKFGPWSMFEGNDFFSSLINQHFTGELVNPRTTSFYVHHFEVKAGTRNDLFIFDLHREGWAKKFQVDQLVL